MVRDRALGETDLLRELGRRGGTLAQQRDDLQPRVAGERAELVDLGDDEDVVELVVGNGKREETVDSRRNIRQLSTVRKHAHAGGGAIAAAGMSVSSYGSNVPRGPAGAGKAVVVPGTALPGTPLTASVENAKVSCAKAIRSLLTSSAWSLLFANVSQARW